MNKLIRLPTLNYNNFKSIINKRSIYFTTTTTNTNVINNKITTNQPQSSQQSSTNKLNEIYDLMKLTNNQYGNNNNSNNNNTTTINSNNNNFSINYYEEIFKQFMDRLNLKNKSNLIVGVSGGSDSIMLLSLLKDWCENENQFNSKRKLTITAITIDHKMSDPVAEDIPVIKNIINKLINRKNNNNNQDENETTNSSIIKHKVIEIKDFSTNKSAIQERFRNQRLEILLSEANSNSNSNGVGSGNNIIFYGSNLNDQIETFIQRINKNSGLDGLAVMRKLTKISTNGSILIRPLLDFSKYEILEYCKIKNIEFYYDPTNDSTCYNRNNTRFIIKKFDQFNIEKHSNNNTNMVIRNFKQFFNGMSAIQEIKEQTDKVIYDVINEILKYNKNFNNNNNNNNQASNQFPSLIMPFDFFNSLPTTIASRVLYKLKCIINQEYSHFYQKKFNEMVHSIRKNPNKPISSNKLFIYVYSIKKIKYLVTQLSIPVDTSTSASTIANQFILPINKNFKYYSFKIKITLKNKQEGQIEEEEIPKLSIRTLEEIDFLNLEKSDRDKLSKIYRYQRLCTIVFTDASNNQVLCIPSLNIQTIKFKNNFNFTFEMDKLCLNNIKTYWEEI